MLVAWGVCLVPLWVAAGCACVLLLAGTACGVAALVTLTRDIVRGCRR